MTKTNEPIRKTVYLEEKLVRQAEILFGESEVDSFSAFVTKAIENYITKLVIDKNGDLLSKEIRKAIHEEISPTNTASPKGCTDTLSNLICLLRWWRISTTSVTKRSLGCGRKPTST